MASDKEKLDKIKKYFTDEIMRLESYMLEYPDDRHFDTELDMIKHVKKKTEEE